MKGKERKVEVKDFLTAAVEINAVPDLASDWLLLKEKR